MLYLLSRGIRQLSLHKLRMVKKSKQIYIGIRKAKNKVHNPFLILKFKTKNVMKKSLKG